MTGGSGERCSELRVFLAVIAAKCGSPLSPRSPCHRTRVSPIPPIDAQDGHPRYDCFSQGLRLCFSVKASAKRGVQYSRPRSFSTRLVALHSIAMGHSSHSLSRGLVPIVVGGG